MVFVKGCFETVDFEKKSADYKNACKITHHASNGTTDGCTSHWECLNGPCARFGINCNFAIGDNIANTMLVWFKHIYFKSVHTIQYNFQSYKH